MAIQTGKIQATINGQTVTIAEVALAINVSTVLATPVSQDEVISLSFDRPIKVDAGTAINLVTANDVATTVFTASIGTITNGF